MTHNSAERQWARGEGGRKGGLPKLCRGSAYKAAFKAELLGGAGRGRSSRRPFSFVKSCLSTGPRARAGLLRASENSDSSVWGPARMGTHLHNDGADEFVLPTRSFFLRQYGIFVRKVCLLCRVPSNARALHLKLGRVSLARSPRPTRHRQISFQDRR